MSKQTKVAVKDIQITCECGHVNEICRFNIFVRDTTPCSCGQCRGESYEVSFGDCKGCGSELVHDR